MPRRRSTKHHPRPSRLDLLREEITAPPERAERVEDRPPAPDLDPAIAARQSREVARSLERSRLLLTTALALDCACGAIAGEPCFTGARGFCFDRYVSALGVGVSAESRAASPSREPAVVGAGRVDPDRELDWRHPNRQWGGSR
jgi:hypothetical protein